MAKSASKAKFELYRSKKNKRFYWRLVHITTGDIIADSGQGYTAKASAKKGIRSVKKNVPGAPIVEVSDK